MRIFDDQFQPSKFEDRLKMQKAIYLLQNMGINVGDYKFIWYKHGPYSQTLQNDILNIQQAAKDNDIEFSSDANRAIEKLKQALSKEKAKYDMCQWIECLGSLQYIKENILRSSATDDEILDELQNRKPHLDKPEENHMALQTLKHLSI